MKTKPFIIINNNYTSKSQLNKHPIVIYNPNNMKRDNKSKEAAPAHSNANSCVETRRHLIVKSACLHHDLPSKMQVFV